MVVVENRKSLNLKSVMLPAEHGGWGFLVEPIILSLIAAFSGAAFLFGLAMLSVFLIHQPIKIAAKDRIKGRYTERTLWADRFVFIYGGIACILLVLLSVIRSTSFWVPIALAFPLMLLQFRYDLHNKSRDLIPEISGAVALGAIAPSIALLNGWEFIPALILWLVIGLRAVPAILYVRARLRLERNKPAMIFPANVAHALTFVVSIALVVVGTFPWIVAVALGLLMVRSAWGLSSYRKPASRPAVIGIQELIYGLLYATVVGMGYALQ